MPPVSDLDLPELRDLLITLLLAGFDTSKNQLMLTMYTPLDHPGMYARRASEVTWRPFRSGAWGIGSLPIEFTPGPADV